MFPSYLCKEEPPLHTLPVCPWGIRLTGRAKLCCLRQPNPAILTSVGPDPGSPDSPKVEPFSIHPRLGCIWEGRWE